MLFRSLGLSACIFMAAGVASAAVRTYDITFKSNAFDYTGELTFTLDFDFASDQSVDQTVGLTIDSINFALDGAAGFNFYTVNQYLVVGGLINDVGGVNFNTNDFRFYIGGDAGANPVLEETLSVIAQDGGVEDIRDTTLTVTDLAPVPLPAALPLLGGALAGIALFRRRDA